MGKIKMLIKESSIRRIIREEAYRMLREEAGAPELDTKDAARTGIVERLTKFAATFAVAAPGGGSKAFLLSIKDLAQKGTESRYASSAAEQPQLVNNARRGSRGSRGSPGCVELSRENDRLVWLSSEGRI
jgi:hypothetical protein